LTFSLSGTVPAGASITAAGVFTWTPSAAGDYTFDVVVNDGSLTDSETITVSVTGGGNTAPIASFTMTKAKLVVSVNGSASSDPDGSIASYAWNFGDGGVATGVTASHTYALWGTWWVTLTVTDNLGKTGSTSQQVTVSNPPDPLPPPYNVFGYVTDGSGNPVADAIVTITDLRTGNVWMATSSNDGYAFYMVDLNSNMTGYTSGDTIRVTVTSGSLSGSASGVVGAPGNEAYLWLDVVLTPGGLSLDDGYVMARTAKT
jgi:PKD repeat protein